MSKPSLILVGTPLGNLGDFSARAQTALQTADVILAEDTRVTKKLCLAFHITTPLLRCDENVIRSKSAHLVERMKTGITFAFVSDAGMPAISDPGQKLVDATLDEGLLVDVIPGPSAVSCAIALCGLVAQTYCFEGFLPRKAAERDERIKVCASRKPASVIYESPHRVCQTIQGLARLAPKRRIALCREMTKLHQEVMRGSAHDVSEICQKRAQIKGECVLVIEEQCKQSGTNTAEEPLASTQTPELRRALVAIKACNLPTKQAASLLAQTFALSKKAAYNMILEQDGAQSEIANGS